MGFTDITRTDTVNSRLRSIYTYVIPASSKGLAPRISCHSRIFKGGGSLNIRHSRIFIGGGSLNIRHSRIFIGGGSLNILSFPRRRESMFSTCYIIQTTCYVYIMTSKKNGTHYISITNHLRHRGWQHKNDVQTGFIKNIGRIFGFSLRRQMMVGGLLSAKSKCRSGMSNDRLV